MNNDKSPIDSFNVSLGRAPTAGSVRQDAALWPWNILVCSDLGFKSVKPRRVTVAEWNEFMAAENIVVSGTIEQALAPFQSPMFIEHTIRSMTDFSPETMKSLIPAISGYSRLLDTLAAFLDGTEGRESVLSALSAVSLTNVEKDRLSAALGANGAGPDAARKTEQKKPGSSAVASILSMVDVSGSTPDPAPKPHTAIDGVLSAFSYKTDPVADKVACRAFLDAGIKTLDAQIAAIRTAPFFAERKAAWNGLFQCVKAIGRTKELRLYVFSAPGDERDEIANMLTAEFGASEDSPDIIVWDFPVAFTQADMDRLTRLSVVADRFKSVVIAPLSAVDDLFENIASRSDFAPVFEDIRFLPYKKFRSSIESREVCLCGPDLMVYDSAVARNAPSIAFPTHCCWPLTIRWIELLISNLDPFAIDGALKPQETNVSENASFHPPIPEPVCKEAFAIAGITLLSGSPVHATVDRAATAIDPEVAGTAYTSGAFNLLVNRIARLTGRRIVEAASSLPPERLAADIEEFLYKELLACRVCTSPDQVSVKMEDSGALDINLNSDMLVGGHPARFSFSLDIQ